MVVNMEGRGRKDAVLLSLAALFVVLSIAGPYVSIAPAMPFYLKIIVSLLEVAAAAFLIARTAFGQNLWGFWQDSLIELRKVVWPTKQETIHSTVAVLAMVFVMGIVLWSIDAVLVRIMAWIIRQGAV